jgi:homoserine dehydrogenase
VASVIQRETQEDAGPTGTVSLVIMTHAATEGAADAALAEINRFESVRGDSVRMRVLD